ncbi:hypothetical protein JKP88DRAFT_254317 [Tribonema minus]|uniref:Uncharacterized protein n=1 Tax=Tribonema minus TaxID=303371 RepID=A0A835Z3A9_9STRA|nr:hypothetical protein JKP88DRAFT_254317 [Tribonema minus]
MSGSNSTRINAPQAEVNKPGVVACDDDWASVGAQTFKKKQPWRYLVWAAVSKQKETRDFRDSASGIADAFDVAITLPTAPEDVLQRYMMGLQLQALFDTVDLSALSKAGRSSASEVFVAVHSLLFWPSFDPETRFKPSGPLSRMPRAIARKVATELGVPVVTACRPSTITLLRMADASVATDCDPVMMLRACLGHALASSAQPLPDPTALKEQRAADHTEYYEALAQTNPQLYKVFVTEHAAYMVEGLLHHMQSTDTKRAFLIVGMRHKRAVGQYLTEKNSAQEPEVALSPAEVVALVQE